MFLPSTIKHSLIIFALGLTHANNPFIYKKLVVQINNLNYFSQLLTIKTSFIMKCTLKFLFTIVLMSPIFISSQNTLPASGNVGIGTATPACQLEVQGNTDLIGKVVMRDSVKVDGELLIEQNVVIKGSTKNLGEMMVLGDFSLPSLSDTAAIPSDRIMFIKPNGKAESMEKSGLINIIYDPYDCSKDGITFPKPIWSNSQGVNSAGVLYTGDLCPASVGIGTNAPLGTFDVRGASYFSGNMGIGMVHNNGSRLSISQSNPINNGTQINFLTTSNNSSGNALQIVLNNDDRKAINVNNEVIDVFSVHGDGRTIIRTTNVSNPAFKIVNENIDEDVFRIYNSGYIEAKKMKLSYTIWADHVFEDEYKLLSIGQLEKFIEENGHLPNVPDTKNVLKNGVDVGEMDAILLEKIEELSLYIIDLQKQIEALKNANPTNK